jgi:O-antigen/teichoic acid export membrane protein
MSDPADIKTTVNRGLAWIGAASSMVWLLDIVGIVIILALWISPEEFGVAALAITLFPVLDLATDMGLSAAVIQRDDHTEEKISTVFWINVLVSGLMFAGLALIIGPLLGAFHGEPVVGLMLTAYGAKLLWQNVFLIPAALMRRELRFKELSAIRTVANVAEFAGKVGFAAAGFGVWCFVLGPFCRFFVTGIGVQLRNPWRPRFVLRLREAFDWMRYGLKTSASQMLFHLYTNVDYQVVGYVFGAEANGFYRLGYEIVLEPCRMISQTLLAIAFPAYAKLKAYRDKLVEQFIVFTRMSLVVMLGFLSVVFVTADDMVVVFWGAEWTPAAAVARILCAVGVLRALSFVVPPLLDGVGRPGLTLTYTIVASILLPGLFVASAYALGDRYDYLSVAIAWVVGYPIAFLVLFALALRVLKLNALQYIRRVAGIPACAALAMGAGWLAGRLGESWAANVRFAGSAACVVAVFGLSLAYLQGISPRSIARAVRGESTAADSGDLAAVADELQ